jgi:hypothetical protein
MYETPMQCCVKKNEINARNRFYFMLFALQLIENQIAHQCLMPS